MTKDMKLTDKNWNEITAASGPASFIPKAIAGLVSDDPKQRHDARFTLDNEAVRQSDLYEAAAYCIGPLVESLRSNPKHGKAEIYCVLVEIAEGYAPPSVTVVSESGEPISVKSACAAQLRRARDVFALDTDDSEIGDLATELLDAIDADDE